MIAASFFAFGLAQTVRYPQVFEAPIVDGEGMEIMLLDKAKHAMKVCPGQYPSISPTGTTFAFAETKWMPGDEVLPGLYSRLKTAAAAPTKAAPKTLITYKGPVTISMPMFSPDGKQICYEVTSQRPDIDDPQRGIYVISAQGGAAKLLYKPKVKPVSMTWPTWTDAGKKVVLADGDDIVWVDVKTKATTKKPSSYLIGDWSKQARLATIRPDQNSGRYAFTLMTRPGSDYNDRNAKVYLVKPGASPAAISGPGLAWHPRWDATGKFLLFYEVGPDHDIAGFHCYDPASSQNAAIWTP